MQKTIVFPAIFYLCALRPFAAALDSESAGATTAADTIVKFGKQAARINIDRIGSLDAQGAYIHLVGQSLFLTPGRVMGKPKAQTGVSGVWFDISESQTSPRAICNNLPEAWDVAIAGNYALTCIYTPSIFVHDIRNRQWRQIASVDLPSNAENIIVRENLAYVAAHEAGFAVIDIANPESPRILSILDAKIDCDAIALIGDSAALYGHHENQIVMVDIADPAAPRILGTCTLPVAFNGGEMEASGEFVYATTKSGLAIVRISDPSNPSLIKIIEFGAVAHDVILRDRYAFVAAGEGGVRVLDISDPFAPNEAGYFEASTDFLPVAIAVERAARAKEGAAADLDADYVLYAANLAGPAAILGFRAP